MSDDYERGYEDGSNVGRDARRLRESDNELEKSADNNIGVEDLIEESLPYDESEEYQKGFRKGVEDAW